MSAVFFMHLAKEVKVTPPGRHVTPTEPDFGFTGNLLRRVATVWHVMSLGFLPQPCRLTGLS